MKILSSFLILMSLSGAANAAMSPVSISIFPPVQFPPEEYAITGVRLSLLYGKQRDVYGLDLALGGNTTLGNFTGVRSGRLFNNTQGTTTIIGLQAALGANVNTSKTTIVGLQIAAVNYNSAEASVTGLQLALSNYNEHTRVYGIEAGIYNKAQDVYGLQIGLVNVANNLHGLQIGLLNFNTTGLLAVSPILNAGF